MKISIIILTLASIFPLELAFAEDRMINITPNGTYMTTNPSAPNPFSYDSQTRSEIIRVKPPLQKQENYDTKFPIQINPEINFPMNSSSSSNTSQGTSQSTK